MQRIPYLNDIGTEIVSSLMTQLSWTSHLKLMSACKTIEERRFYMELAIKERYSVRELERQIVMLNQLPNNVNLISFTIIQHDA